LHRSSPGEMPQHVYFVRANYCLRGNCNPKLQVAQMCAIWT